MTPVIATIPLPPKITLLQLSNGWFQLYAETKIKPDSHGLSNTVTSYVSVNPAESVQQAFDRLSDQHAYHLSHPNNEDHAY